MKDDSLLELSDGSDDWPSAPAAAPSSAAAAPPPDRESVLARCGPVKRAIYRFVRRCVDDFERTAPWMPLYYPPQDTAELVSLIGGLLDLLRSIPKRVEALLAAIPAGEGGDEPGREEVAFLFLGIHRMAAHEIKRIEGVLAPFRSAEGAPSASAGELLCELSADLKGKYASALMGAAASLMAQGVWNSVELEPVLFPEKAEEFRCTRELVDSLKEMIAAIRHLPEQIPFAALLERWRNGQRVDQYALADLPTLRGKLARLLRERSRRALYSGDYHQISRREVLLSERANELERLHQQTWAATSAGLGSAQELAPVFARLTELTLEIAAVLDVAILKTLLGDKTVESLRARVTMSKGRPLPATGEMATLLPLLAEDDLRIFFDLLLGNVQRRACLSVPPPAEPDAAPPPPPAAAPAASAPSPPRRAPPPPPPLRPELRAACLKIHVILAELMSPGHPPLNAFRMTQRLLGKSTRIPMEMFRSIHPYLEEIRNRLVPELQILAPFQGITEEVVDRLDGYCYDLLYADPSLATLRDEIPKKMERLLRFLEAVRAAVPNPGV